MFTCLHKKFKLNTSARSIVLAAIICAGAAFIGNFSLYGQVRIENLPDAPGKVSRKPNTLAFIQGFKVLSTAKASSLAGTADKIMDMISHLPPLVSPKGFNVDFHVSGLGTELREKAPRFSINCWLRYLTKNSRYTGVKESMDGADLYLKVNDFDIFSQMGNYWEDCYKFKLPLFFESPVLSASTGDYIEFPYKGDPVRIVLASKKPLLIPLTRREYIQFLIQSRQAALKSDSDAVKTSLEGQLTIKKLLRTGSESDRAYAASSLKSMDYSISQFRKNIEKDRQELTEYKQLMATMSPEQAGAPVRVDYSQNKSGNLASLLSLVPTGSASDRGTLLVKINPDYYDRSASAPTAQLLVMYYAIPGLDYGGKPDYLDQAMLDIFNEIDYHALKAAMQ